MYIAKYTQNLVFSYTVPRNEHYYGESKAVYKKCLSLSRILLSRLLVPRIIYNGKREWNRDRQRNFKNGWFVSASYRRAVCFEVYMVKIEILFLWFYDWKFILQLLIKFYVCKWS